MSYHLVRGAQNTIQPRMITRRWARRGMGQACCTSVDDDGNCQPPCTSSGPLGPNTQNTTPTSTTNPFGGFSNPAPLPNPTSGLLNPGSPIDVGGSSYGAVGSNGGCSSGYVVGDSSGNCIPASTLVATLATPGGASSLGLTASQAAVLATAVKAAGTISSIVTGQPATSAIVPANPLSSISPTVLIAGGVGLLLVVLLSSKKR